MIKKGLWLLLMTLLFFFTFSINDNEVSAHRSIEDGGATRSNFSPYDVSRESWNERWNIKGSKDYSMQSGRDLAYDVYSGKSNHRYKKGWQIDYVNDFGKGRQPYLQFWGWSALVGYHHHGKYNQATYILAYNPRTGEEKMYKTEISSLDATEDIEYGKNLSGSNSVYNPCSSGTFRKSNTTCNMYYKWVGFKAWLPLNELFPDGTKHAEWELYIVKNVEGRVVYDELILPFDFNKLDFNNGKIDLSSGVNSSKLRMNGTGVVRRKVPRGSGYSGGRYFTHGKTYTRVAQDESAGAAIWYGVRSPHDNGKTRWTSSAYWTFGGEIATLSYNINKKTCPDGSVVIVTKDCQVNVTIYHVDGDTGERLRTDHDKETVGTRYSYTPESRGTFKKDGNPYVAYPANQKATGTTPNDNFTVTFSYRVALPDPTAIYEIDGATEGKAQGDFLWRLEKGNSNSESRIRLINDLTITGKHYKTRNLSYTIGTQSVFSKTENHPIDIYINTPNSLKNRSVHYSFEYEYTNHYKRNYKCVDQQGSDCFEWEFTKNTPVWGSYANTSRWEKSLSADHNYGETFIFEYTDDPTINLVVGRKATVNGTENSNIPTNVYKEKFTVDNSLISILSQNWIPINETIQYSSDFNNSLYFIPEYMYYYPNDMDKALRDKYKNETPFAFSNYAIPLRVSKHENGLITFNTKDNFFITENTGFLFSLPSSVTSILDINQKAKEAYEAFTGEKYNDKVLTNFVNGSRYYFNINGSGEEKPNTWYEHVYVLSKLGLSDIQIQNKKMVEFDKYLFGSPLDNTLITEELDSVIRQGITYSHSITITPDQQQQIEGLAKDRGGLLHSFRSTDIKEKLNQLKNILPSLSP